MLVQRGARCDLVNLRGDTPLQCFALPRLSPAAVACRSAVRGGRRVGNTPTKEHIVWSLARAAAAAKAVLVPSAAIANSTTSSMKSSSSDLVPPGRARSLPPPSPESTVGNDTVYTL